MSDTENQVLNHVACEACRVKKCKCNRILPTCGQCEKAGTQCVYPQTFKRGFPEGYLAGLEARLAETEQALFEALFMLRSTGSPQTSSPSVDNVFDFKQTKTARMQEWERLPLTTAQDRRNWYFDKANKAGVGLQEDQTFGSPSEVIETTSPWQQSQVHTAGVPPSRLSQFPSSSPMARQSPSERHESISDPSGPSRAEIVSSRQSRKFF